MEKVSNLEKAKKQIENLIEAETTVNERGLLLKDGGEYFTTEMTVDEDGYYEVEIGYEHDDWESYLCIEVTTQDKKASSFTQSLPHGETQKIFSIYLEKGKNTVRYMLSFKTGTQILYLRLLGRQEKFIYEISPKKDIFFLDKRKQPKTFIKNYTDTLVKVEADGKKNIPFKTAKPSQNPLLLPMSDVILDKETVYSLDEGEHKFFYYLQSGKVMEQEIEIRRTLPKAKFEYINFNVNQANATLFRFPNGKYMLVDSGREEAARDKVIPYLEKHSIKLDYYLITHFHSDHDGLRDEIIEKYSLSEPDPQEVEEKLGGDKESRYSYLSSFRYLDSTMLCYYDELDKIWDLGGVKIDVLNSRYDENGEKTEIYKYPFLVTDEHNYENATSVSFMLDFNGFRYYHGADNYAYAQERFMSDMIKAKRVEELNCHWFYANHHFVCDISPIFIRTLNPVAVYVSNDFIYHRETYKKYYKEGVENYFFTNKRLENTLISNEVGSAKVYVNDADDWFYEIWPDEDLFGIKG